MTYIEKCSDEQIQELMRCYAKSYTDISISRRDEVVDVELINDEIPENYIVSDYNVEVFDWDDSGESCLHDFRKKMLEYFGDQYAIDYLLNGV